MRVVVLGAGLVGGPMAVDLSRDDRFEVTSVDRCESTLAKLAGANPSVKTLREDLSDPDKLTETIKGAELVVNAVPGFMGYKTLETVLRSGVNVVDIAFFPEDPFTLNQLAVSKGVTAIVDCGVAPGMSNLLAGHADQLLDNTETILIYVGGLPEKRTWPYEYKAGFSPIDVIEEYTRPARYVENGTLVTRPALSDPELLEFPVIGTLEAFNTDGLRTLATTIDAPNKKEKTLRYVGHIEKMAVLRETGFFDKEAIDVGGVVVSPLAVTANLLFPRWKLEEGEVDLTVMKVIVEGRQDGEKKRYTYDLFDRYDENTGVHSMARTTGYTATVAARMLVEGVFNERGVIVPEWIGKDQAWVDFMLGGLAERGIIYRETVETLEG